MTLWNPPNIGFMLIVVHSIVTRGIAVLADRSQAFAQAGFSDASTQNGFTDYARAFVSGLRGHHQSEDEVVFPFLRENMPDVPYDDLVSNHQEMEAILQEVEAAIAQWEAGGQPAGVLDGLNGAVKRLAEIWQPHIQKEEQHFSIPTLAALIAPEEHARVLAATGEFNRQHTGPDYLVVPVMLYNLSGEERAAMWAAMGPVVTQQLVPVAWKDKWAPMKPFLLP